MQTEYQNKELNTDDVKKTKTDVVDAVAEESIVERDFYFPAEGVTIKAASVEKALAKLKALNKDNH